MTVPPQYMTALQGANALRLARATVRKDVGADRITVAAALRHPACQTASVVDILSWQRSWAMYRAERFLRANAVCSPFQTAGNLTDRQRVLIAKALRLSESQAAA